MKTKDFYSKLKEQGKINNPEFDKFLETITDGEIPDQVVTLFEDSFLTRERAMADRTINNEIWVKALYPVDKEIEKITSMIEGIDKGLANDIRWMIKDLGPDKKVPDTFKQLDKISSSLPKILDKVKAAPVDDEATKKKIADYEKNIQELTSKFTEAEKTYGDQLQAQKAESEKSFHDFKLDTELQNLGNKFTLAEAYEQNRDAITKVLMSDIKSSNDLRLGEKDGQAEILVYDKEGKPRFTGNTPVTVNSLLEEKYKPFLKQSGGGQSNQGQENSRQQSQQQQPKPGVRTGARTTVV